MLKARLVTCFAICAFLLVAGQVPTVSRADEPLQVQPLLGEDELDLSGGFLGDDDLDVLPTAEGRPKITVTLTPRDAKPGDEVVLAVKLSVPSGSYTYSNNPALIGSTTIKVTEAIGVEPVDKSFTPDQAPKSGFDAAFERDVEKHLGDVTWSKKYRISKDSAPNQVSLKGSFDGQVCNKRTCRPVRDKFEVSLASDGGGAEGVDSREYDYRSVIVPERRAGKPEPITFNFDLTPKAAGPGDEVTLTVTAQPGSDYHIYALGKYPTSNGVSTAIKIKSHPGLIPIEEEFQPDRQPEVYKPLDNIIQHVHHGNISWRRRFQVAQDVEAGRFGIDASVLYQICRKGSCRPPMTVSFALGVVEPVKTDGQEPTTDSSSVATNPVSTLQKSQVGKEGLIPFLLTAFVAGFAALLTPCVFPMVPITVSFFLKQSEKEHHRPVTMASAYCFGIMATFTGLGLLMAALFQATSLNQLANNPWLNLGIAGVLVFFGMNLLGMFEIRIPAALLTWSSGGQGHGGIVGVLFMALTFTLVSFTCTFAFAGGLLVLAAKGEYFWPILGMLAFSAAFSLPFFFLALFPSFLQKLPKSGGWMNTVKVTMGLIECGAAFKFLSVADLSWNPVPMIFDFSMVMSAWIVLSMCTGLYLLGVFRLPHDSPAENISVVRLAFAMTFFGLASYLGVGLFGTEPPTGKVWEQIAAFATPRFEGGKGDIGPYLEHDGMRYALDIEKAQSYAKENQQPLFLDFTGVNCPNCRLMEKRMTKTHNRKELEKFVLVQLYTDNIPLMHDRKRADVLLDENRRLQEDWFGDVTLPAYAVVTPDGKTLLATFLGLEQKEGEFAEFLAAGHAKWQQIASGRKPGGTADRTQLRTGATAIR